MHLTIINMNPHTLSESDLPTLSLECPLLAARLTLHRGCSSAYLRRAKIADLGSAEVMEPGQTVHTYKGTPCYMPPELLRAELNMPTEGACREGDWWSAGTAIYEMTFGVSDFPFYVYDQDGAVDWAKTARRIVLEPFETLR